MHLCLINLQRQLLLKVCILLQNFLLIYYWRMLTLHAVTACIQIDRLIHLPWANYFAHMCCFERKTNLISTFFYLPTAVPFLINIPEAATVCGFIQELHIACFAAGTPRPNPSTHTHLLLHTRSLISPFNQSWCYDFAQAKLLFAWYCSSDAAFAADGNSIARSLSSPLPPYFPCTNLPITQALATTCFWLKTLTYNFI
jgi:hypothetical protein